MYEGPLAAGPVKKNPAGDGGSPAGGGHLGDSNEALGGRPRLDGQCGE